MKKLIVSEVAEAYIGKAIDTEKRYDTFESNGKHKEYGTPIEYYEYIAYCPSYEEEFRKLFGISDLLFSKWEYDGIDFRVYLRVDNDVIYDCFILKYKETYGGYHGRPSGYELTPTQQEIRIFRRIMDYVIAGR